MELCQFVIKTIISDLIPNSPFFAQKNSKLWNLVTRLLFGITDNLLWNDKQNYLADELAELLLNSLFLIFLKSEIYCDELWRKFASCFKVWCHRLKSVLVWGSVTVALNSKIAKLIYSDQSNDLEISFGMHSTKYEVIINEKFAKVTWARISSKRALSLFF